MSDREIGKIWKDRRRTDFIAVAIREYQGKTYVDVRQFFQDETGTSRPTKKGITVSPLRFEEFAALVNKALALLREEERP